MMALLLGGRRQPIRLTQLRDGGEAVGLTSGKVPLEKTLRTHVSYCTVWPGADVRREHRRKHVHQQTGLSAGAVADDDELSADFSHGDVCGRCTGCIGR